jgi:type I restriction enzyme, S subunit
LAGEWQEVSVEEIKAGAENALATGPFGSSIGSRFFNDRGVPVIRGSNLSEDIGTRLNDNGLVFLSPEKAREFSRSTVRAGDLVFTCWGTVNQVGLIDSRTAYREYIISNKQMKLTPDPLKADSLFLYYLFSSPALQERIKSQAIGSSVPGFNLGQLREMRILIPEADEQRAIACVLGTLDDKIEINRRMNEALEAMARAFFKSWFVDFDPVRAKMEGRWRRGESLPGLPAHLYDLFPDRLVDSELGAIPDGWQLHQLGELLELAYGKALKAEDRCDGDVPVYGSNGQIGWHDERLASGPGIVVGRKGNPGIVTWATTDFFVIDTAFYVVPKAICHSLHFLFHALERHDLASHGADSAVPGLNRNLAYMSTQVLPTQPLLEQFDVLAALLAARAHHSSKESHTLAALRDSLLPRLISGELRVSDPDQFAWNRQ